MANTMGFSPWRTSISLVTRPLSEDPQKDVGPFQGLRQTAPDLFLGREASLRLQIPTVFGDHALSIAQKDVFLCTPTPMNMRAQAMPARTGAGEHDA